MATKTLGRFIRERRDALDWSLREFARKINCSAGFVSDIELGKRFPGRKVLEDIARVLDVTVEELEQYDIRPPIEELRRRSETDPRYAFALRRIADENVSADDLLKALDQASEEQGETE